MPAPVRPPVFNLLPNALRRAVVLSVDDGSEHDREFVARLERVGARATFHLNSAALDRPGHVRAAEVAALYARHEVAAHTAHHPHLSCLSPGALLGEITRDRAILESLVLQPVTGFSYPYGSHTAALRALLPGLGLEYARCIDSGSFWLPEDFYFWRPTAHLQDRPAERARAFLALRPAETMPLLHLWGHSSDLSGTWPVLDELLDILAEPGDVWFTTLRELRRYVGALQSLVPTLDGLRWYNPTAYPVWFTHDGCPRCIAPGETAALA